MIENKIVKWSIVLLLTIITIFCSNNLLQKKLEIPLLEIKQEAPTCTAGSGGKGGESNFLIQGNITTIEGSTINAGGGEGGKGGSVNCVGGSIIIEQPEPLKLFNFVDLINLISLISSIILNIMLIFSKKSNF